MLSCDPRPAPVPSLSVLVFVPFCLPSFSSHRSECSPSVGPRDPSPKHLCYVCVCIGFRNQQKSLMHVECD